MKQLGGGAGDAVARGDPLRIVVEQPLGQGDDHAGSARGCRLDLAVDRRPDERRPRPAGCSAAGRDRLSRAGRELAAADPECRAARPHELAAITP